MPIHRGIRLRPLSSIVGALFLLLSITGLSADSSRATKAETSSLLRSAYTVADNDAGDTLGSFVVRVPKYDVWAGGRQVLRRTRTELGALPLRDWLTDHVMKDQAIDERGRARAERFVWDLARSALDEGVFAATEEVRRRNFVRSVNVDVDTGLGDRFANLAVNALGPLHESENTVLAWQLRGYAGEKSRKGGNIGAVYRVASEDKWLAGLNSFIDVQTEDGDNFMRWSLGVEARSAWADVFANYYESIGDDIIRRRADNTREAVWTASGYDVELNVHAPSQKWLTGVLGYYAWEGKYGRADVDGLRIGVKVIPHGTRLNWELAYDTADKGDPIGVRVSYHYRFGDSGGGGNSFSSQFQPRDWFYAPVKREYTQRIYKTGIGAAVALSPLSDFSITPVGRSATFTGQVAGVETALIVTASVAAARRAEVINLFGGSTVTLSTGPGVRVSLLFESGDTTVVMYVGSTVVFDGAENNSLSRVRLDDGSISLSVSGRFTVSTPVRAGERPVAHIITDSAEVSIRYDAEEITVNLSVSGRFTVATPAATLVAAAPTELDIRYDASADAPAVAATIVLNDGAADIIGTDEPFDCASSPSARAAVRIETNCPLELPRLVLNPDYGNDSDDLSAVQVGNRINISYLVVEQPDTADILATIIAVGGRGDVILEQVGAASGLAFVLAANQRSGVLRLSGTYPTSPEVTTETLVVRVTDEASPPQTRTVTITVQVRGRAVEQIAANFGVRGGDSVGDPLARDGAPNAAVAVATIAASRGTGVHTYTRIRGDLLFNANTGVVSIPQGQVVGALLSIVVRVDDLLSDGSAYAPTNPVMLTLYVRVRAVNYPDLAVRVDSALTESGGRYQVGRSDRPLATVNISGGGGTYTFTFDNSVGRRDNARFALVPGANGVAVLRFVGGELPPNGRYTVEVDIAETLSGESTVQVIVFQVTGPPPLSFVVTTLSGYDSENDNLVVTPSGNRVDIAYFTTRPPATGAAFARVAASGGNSGGLGAVTFVSGHSGLFFNPVNSRIRLTEAARNTEETRSLRVRVTDSSTKAVLEEDIIVRLRPRVIDALTANFVGVTGTQTNPHEVEAFTGEANAFTRVQGGDGVTPYTYTKVKGELELDGNGMVSIPAAGVSMNDLLSIVVRVSDSLPAAQDSGGVTDDVMVTLYVRVTAFTDPGLRARVQSSLTGDGSASAPLQANRSDDVLANIILSGRGDVSGSYSVSRISGSSQLELGAITTVATAETAEAPLSFSGGVLPPTGNYQIVVQAALAGVEPFLLTVHVEVPEVASVAADLQINDAYASIGGRTDVQLTKINNTRLSLSYLEVTAPNSAALLANVVFAGGSGATLDISVLGNAANTNLVYDSANSGLRLKAGIYTASQTNAVAVITLQAVDMGTGRTVNLPLTVDVVGRPIPPVTISVVVPSGIDGDGSQNNPFVYDGLKSNVGGQFAVSIFALGGGDNSAIVANLGQQMVLAGSFSQVNTGDEIRAGVGLNFAVPLPASTGSAVVMAVVQIIDSGPGSDQTPNSTFTVYFQLNNISEVPLEVSLVPGVAGAISGDGLAEGAALQLSYANRDSDNLARLSASGGTGDRYQYTRIDRAGGGDTMQLGANTAAATRGVVSAIGELSPGLHSVVVRIEDNHRIGRRSTTPLTVAVYINVANQVQELQYTPFAGALSLVYDNTDTVADAGTEVNPYRFIIGTHGDNAAFGTLSIVGGAADLAACSAVTATGNSPWSVSPTGVISSAATAAENAVGSYNMEISATCPGADIPPYTFRHRIINPLSATVEPALDATDPLVVERQRRNFSGVLVDNLAVGVAVATISGGGGDGGVDDALASYSYTAATDAGVFLTVGADGAVRFARDASAVTVAATYKITVVVGDASGAPTHEVRMTIAVPELLSFFVEHRFAHFGFRTPGEGGTRLRGAGTEEDPYVLIATVVARELGDAVFRLTAVGAGDVTTTVAGERVVTENITYTKVDDDAFSDIFTVEDDYRAVTVGAAGEETVMSRNRGEVSFNSTEGLSTGPHITLSVQYEYTLGDATDTTLTGTIAFHLTVSISGINMRYGRRSRTNSPPGLLTQENANANDPIAPDSTHGSAVNPYRFVLGHSGHVASDLGIRPTIIISNNGVPVTYSLISDATNPGGLEFIDANAHSNVRFAVAPTAAGVYTATITGVPTSGLLVTVVPRPLIIHVVDPLTSAVSTLAAREVVAAGVTSYIVPRTDGDGDSNLAGAPLLQIVGSGGDGSIPGFASYRYGVFDMVDHIRSGFKRPSIAPPVDGFSSNADFRVNVATGEISFARDVSAVTVAADYKLTIRVDDITEDGANGFRQAGDVLMHKFILTISVPGVPVLTAESDLTGDGSAASPYSVPESLSNGTAGNPLIWATVSASGGVGAPYTYGTNSTLVSVDPNGVIALTTAARRLPVLAAAYNITLTATDSIGNVGGRVLAFAQGGTDVTVLIAAGLGDVVKGASGNYTVLSTIESGVDIVEFEATGISFASDTASSATNENFILVSEAGADTVIRTKDRGAAPHLTVSEDVVSIIPDNDNSKAFQINLRVVDPLGLSFTSLLNGDGTAASPFVVTRNDLNTDRILATAGGTGGTDTYDYSDDNDAFSVDADDGEIRFVTLPERGAVGAKVTLTVVAANNPALFAAGEQEVVFSVQGLLSRTILNNDKVIGGSGTAEDPFLVSGNEIVADENLINISARDGGAISHTRIASGSSSQLGLSGNAVHFADTAVENRGRYKIILESQIGGAAGILSTTYLQVFVPLSLALNSTLTATPAGPRLTSFEHFRNGAILATAVAIGGNDGNYRYSVNNSNFIVENNGEIRFAGALESVTSGDTYTVEVAVTDDDDATVVQTIEIFVHKPISIDGSQVVFYHTDPPSQRNRLDTIGFVRALVTVGVTTSLHIQIPRAELRDFPSFSNFPGEIVRLTHTGGVGGFSAVVEGAISGQRGDNLERVGDSSFSIIRTRDLGTALDAIISANSCTPCNLTLRVSDSGDNAAHTPDGIIIIQLELVGPAFTVASSLVGADAGSAAAAGSDENPWVIPSVDLKNGFVLATISDGAVPGVTFSRGAGSSDIFAVNAGTGAVSLARNVLLPPTDTKYTLVLTATTSDNDTTVRTLVFLVRKIASEFVSKPAVNNKLVSGDGTEASPYVVYREEIVADESIAEVVLPSPVGTGDNYSRRAADSSNELVLKLNSTITTGLIQFTADEPAAALYSIAVDWHNADFAPPNTVAGQITVYIDVQSAPAGIRTVVNEEVFGGRVSGNGTSERPYVVRRADLLSVPQFSQILIATAELPDSFSVPPNLSSNPFTFPDSSAPLYAVAGGEIGFSVSDVAVGEYSIIISTTPGVTPSAERTVYIQVVDPQFEVRLNVHAPLIVSDFTRLLTDNPAGTFDNPYRYLVDPQIGEHLDSGAGNENLVFGALSVVDAATGDVSDNHLFSVYDTRETGGLVVDAQSGVVFGPGLVSGEDYEFIFSANSGDQLVHAEPDPSNSDNQNVLFDPVDPVDPASLHIRAVAPLHFSVTPENAVSLADADDDSLIHIPSSVIVTRVVVTVAQVMTTMETDDNGNQIEVHKLVRTTVTTVVRSTVRTVRDATAPVAEIIDGMVVRTYELPRLNSDGESNLTVGAVAAVVEGGGGDGEFLIDFSDGTAVPQSFYTYSSESGDGLAIVTNGVSVGVTMINGVETAVYESPGEIKFTEDASGFAAARHSITVTVDDFSGVPPHSEVVVIAVPWIALEDIASRCLQGISAATAGKLGDNDRCHVTETYANRTVAGEANRKNSFFEIAPSQSIATIRLKSAQSGLASTGDVKNRFAFDEFGLRVADNVTLERGIYNIVLELEDSAGTNVDFTVFITVRVAAGVNCNVVPAVLVNNTGSESRPCTKTLFGNIANGIGSIFTNVFIVDTAEYNKLELTEGTLPSAGHYSLGNFVGSARALRVTQSSVAGDPGGPGNTISANNDANPSYPIVFKLTNTNDTNIDAHNVTVYIELK